MKPNAVILADSINPAAQRITTYLLPRFPKVLLAELNTHRMLSRNAASSRAVLLEKMIENIRADMYLPDWTAKQAGMGGTRLDDPDARRQLDALATLHFDDAVSVARSMYQNGAAKENVNRYLEPWMRVPVIVTGTEWGGFFSLRTDVAAQSDFRQTALKMLELRNLGNPQRLDWGDWHLPLLEDEDVMTMSLPALREVSVARAARVSYTDQGKGVAHAVDKALHDRLLANKHLSPFEHQVRATLGNHANFRGWQSYRSELGY